MPLDTNRRRLQNSRHPTHSDTVDAINRIRTCEQRGHAITHVAS
jgi:hypothetical protein